MHCYEHEMLCRALEAEIRALDPLAVVDPLDVSDALASHGLNSFAALARDDLSLLAGQFIEFPLAA